MSKNIGIILLDAAISALFFFILLTVTSFDVSNASNDGPDDCGEFWSFTIHATFTGSNAQSIEWDFGDGTPTVTEWNPFHTYETIGTYIVTQTVYNNFEGGSSAIGQFIIHIMGRPYVELHQPAGAPDLIENRIYTNIHSFAIQPADPIWEGHDFEGWFSDKELTIPFDWSLSIEAPVKAYASYSKDTPHTINYAVNILNSEGAIAETFTVRDGRIISAPSDTMSYYYDIEMTEEVDWTAPITSSINIYQKEAFVDNGLKFCGEFWSFTIHATFTGSNAQSVEWDFGDGTPTVTEWNPFHTYETIGTYIVTQTVYNNFEDGSFVTDRFLVRIMGEPYVELHQPNGAPDLIENRIYTNIHSFAIQPADPIWRGHDFEGWFSDKELTIPFDWSLSIEAPVKAYASYSKNLPWLLTTLQYSKIKECGSE